MADAGTYRLWLRFRCDDHRLTGQTEQQIDGTFLWRATLGELISAVKPAILAQFPHISDSIDYITIEELRLLAS